MRGTTMIHGHHWFNRLKVVDYGVVSRIQINGESSLKVRHLCLSFFERNGNFEDIKHENEFIK